MAPVVACGADLYAVNHVTNSEHQSFFQPSQFGDIRAEIDFGAALARWLEAMEVWSSDAQHPAFGEMFQTLPTQTEVHCLSAMNEELQTEQIWGG